MHPAPSAPRSTLRVPACALLRVHANRCRVFGLLAAVMLAALPTVRAHAQRSEDLGFTYNQELTRFVGDTEGANFDLRGATIDFSADLWKGLGLSANGTGLAATNLRGYEDIQHIQFMAGPRYTLNWGHNSPMVWGRHGGIFIEGKIGYTIATSGYYPVNGVSRSSASALTYSAGGGINFKIYHRFDLRLIEADYVRTQLPNGTTNIQNTIRAASGINFHFGR